MGALAKKIESNPSPSGRRYTCRIDTICEDDDDRKAVADILANRDMSINAKANTLGVHATVVVKHQAKHCACFKAGA